MHFKYKDKYEEHKIQKYMVKWNWLIPIIWTLLQNTGLYIQELVPHKGYCGKLVLQYWQSILFKTFFYKWEKSYIQKLNFIVIKL